MLGDHILHSHDFSGLKCVDIAKRNLTLITIGASRVKTLCHLHASITVCSFSKQVKTIQNSVIINVLNNKTTAFILLNLAEYFS